jgi:hypothetical protein
MQDRYAGDVGDYAKLGLLRQLVQPTPFSPPLRIAVVWYLTRNETGNSDGRHISYLQDTHLRACDPELHDALKEVIKGGQRSVQTLESCALLPSDRTMYYSAAMPDIISNGGGHRSSATDRQNWFAEATKATKTADLVFLDPDNGVEVPSAPYSSVRAGKYVYLSEVRVFLERSQSVLLYQHHHRQVTTSAQIKQVMERLRPLAVCDSDIIAFTFRRGSVRSFYLIAADAHSKMLGNNISKLKNSPWASFFSLSRA